MSKLCKALDLLLSLSTGKAGREPYDLKRFRSDGGTLDQLEDSPGHSLTGYEELALQLIQMARNGSIDAMKLLIEILSSPLSVDKQEGCQTL